MTEEPPCVGKTQCYCEEDCVLGTSEEREEVVKDIQIDLACTERILYGRAHYRGWKD